MVFCTIKNSLMKIKIALLITWLMMYDTKYSKKQEKQINQKDKTINSNQTKTWFRSCAWGRANHDSSLHMFFESYHIVFKYYICKVVLIKKFENVAYFGKDHRTNHKCTSDHSKCWYWIALQCKF